jgi:curved DNA-binding protein CbpA
MRVRVRRVMIKDYYTTLGLGPDSSAVEIKKAYRRLAMKYHPDRNNGNSESEERLKEINEAYHVLGDENKRRYYDLQKQQISDYRMFYEGSLDDDFLKMLRRFYQRDMVIRGKGGCGKMGFGRGGCKRWKWGI